MQTKLPTQPITNFLKSLDLRLNITTKAGIILQKANVPVSKGHLELRNTDPENNQSVTFNYNQDPEDLNKCVEGLNTIIKVIDSKAYSKYKDPKSSTRGLLNLVLALPINVRPRHITSTFDLKHYHGSCQVGKVVYNDYKVLGIDGLRVIDGSKFLKSPGTNPQATVMMLGRYMGMKILRERTKAEEKNKRRIRIEL